MGPTRRKIVAQPAPGWIGVTMKAVGAQYADRIIHARVVHTLDADETIVEAVAVTDGLVSAVGSLDALSPLIGPSTIVDRFSGALTPGLNDGHTHVVWGLELTRGVQLTDLTFEEVAAAISAEVQATNQAGWIHGWGLDPNVFTESGFSGKVFDEITGDIPLFLRLRDGHSAVINSAAIRSARLTGAEEFPDESRIDTDVHGAPTGYVLELRAMNLVLSFAPAQDIDVLAGQLKSVLEGMADTGIVSTDVMDFDPLTPVLLNRLERLGPLPLRLRCHAIVPAGAAMSDLRAVHDLQGTGGDRWEVRGVKFFMDGTIDNGSAWLEAPDAYGQGRKSIWTDPAAYRSALLYFASRGIPTATHAIGDRAVSFVLESFESFGPEGVQGSHRIEHIETIPDDLVGRFAPLGIAASMQPVAGTHHTRADLTDNWSIRLGPERARHGWRCRDLRDAGAVVALGSDWPITPYDARVTMADTVLRRPVEKPGVEPITPEQGLTLREALEGYTTHAARAAGLEEVAGSIAVGKRADFTVWESDPLATEAEHLPEISIVTTYVGGLPRT